MKFMKITQVQVSEIIADVDAFSSHLAESFEALRNVFRSRGCPKIELVNSEVVENLVGGALSGRYVHAGDGSTPYDFENATGTDPCFFDVKCVRYVSPNAMTGEASLHQDFTGHMDDIFKNLVDATSDDLVQRMGEFLPRWVKKFASLGKPYYLLFVAHDLPNNQLHLYAFRVVVEEAEISLRPMAQSIQVQDGHDGWNLKFYKAKKRLEMRLKPKHLDNGLIVPIGAEHEQVGVY